MGADYTRAVDMWSFGCIIVELALGKPVFSGGSEFDHLNQINALVGPLPPTLLARSRKLMDYYEISGTPSHGSSFTLKQYEVYSKEKGLPHKPWKGAPQRWPGVICRLRDVSKVLVLKSNEPSDAAEEFADFLSGCLRIDPNARYVRNAFGKGKKSTKKNHNTTTNNRNRMAHLHGVKQHTHMHMRVCARVSAMLSDTFCVLIRIFFPFPAILFLLFFFATAVVVLFTAYNAQYDCMVYAHAHTHTHMHKYKMSIDASQKGLILVQHWHTLLLSVIAAWQKTKDLRQLKAEETEGWKVVSLLAQEAEEQEEQETDEQERMNSGH